MSTTPRSILLFAALALGAGACTSILGGFDFEGKPGGGGNATTSSSTTTTGSGGTGTTGGGGTGTGGTTGCAQACTDATECPQPDNSECGSATCQNGCCGMKVAGDGFPVLQGQVTGDCQKIVCDTGTDIKIVDDTTDVPKPKDECNLGACSGNHPVQTPTTGSCTQGNGKPGVCAGTSTPQAGTCVECNVASDCGPPSSLCVPFTCDVSHACKSASPAPIGAACDDNGGKVCDGAGKCLGCISSTDCVVPEICDPNKKQCASPNCTDGSKNGTETDTDCGGTCPVCDLGKLCLANTDCKSEYCALGASPPTCKTPTCGDGVKNGAETDIDCGGSTCNQCANGKGCAIGKDCTSGVCNAATKTCSAPTCTDGVKNGGETDVDCGGSACNGCLYGQTCTGSADCLTPVCTANRCAAQTVVSGQGTLTALAIDPKFLYFTTKGGAAAATGTVVKALLSNFTLTTLASGQGQPAGIAVSSTTVFWTNSASNTVARCALPNCTTVTALATAQPTPGPIVLDDGGTLAWFNKGTGDIKIFLPNATGPSTAASGQDGVQQMAIDGARVYWTQFVGAVGAIGVFRYTTGSLGTIATAQKTPVGIAVDATNVYWSNSVLGGAIKKAPIVSGTETTITNAGFPYAVAVDATHVYYTVNANPGTISKAPIAGGVSTLLADEQDRPFALVVDATYVYWANQDGTIRRIHK